MRGKTKIELPALAESYSLKQAVTGCGRLEAGHSRLLE